MATIDSNILLQARPPDVMQAAANGLNVGAAMQQMPIKNRLLESQVQAQELQNKASRQTLDAETAKFQLQDAASDAVAIRPLVESGDTLRANVLLAERIKKIQDRGGDPSDTIALRDQLNAGNVKGVLGELKTVEDLATRVGIFDNGTGASNRSFAPVPMTDENGNFTGYAVPTVDASGKATMQPISGSERALSPIDLAMARENIGVQGYGQRRQIEAATAPIIAGGAKDAELDAEGRKRPQIEADIAKARAEAEDLVQQTISKRSSANTLEAAQILKTNLSGNLDSIYGRGESLYPNLLRSQKGIDLMADRDQLVGMLVLAGRGQLKGQGPITESEQGVIQKAISVLSSQDISPARAEMALNDAFKVLETSAGKSSPDSFSIDGVTVTRKK